MYYIVINSRITISIAEITFDYFRSSGSGGQHVNKVETGVRLRFDINSSQAVPQSIKKILFSRNKRKINDKGELLIESTIYKSQHRKKQEVINRLKKLIHDATKKKKKRIKTKPTKTSVEKRISNKKRRSNIKKLRKIPNSDDL